MLLSTYFKKNPIIAKKHISARWLWKKIELHYLKKIDQLQKQSLKQKLI